MCAPFLFIASICGRMLDKVHSLSQDCATGWCSQDRIASSGIQVRVQVRTHRPLTLHNGLHFAAPDLTQPLCMRETRAKDAAGSSASSCHMLPRNVSWMFMRRSRKLGFSAQYRAVMQATQEQS